MLWVQSCKYCLWVKVWICKSCLTSWTCWFIVLMTLGIFFCIWGIGTNCQGELLCNCKRLNLVICQKSSSYLVSTCTTVLSSPAACIPTRMLTRTFSVFFKRFFVGMWLSWVQCGHMTASVKCEFGWQRKESLYLWNSKHLHAKALRGENAELACHSLIEMSFSYVWRIGSIFSYKYLFLLQVPWPLLYSLFFFFFFFCQHFPAVEFSILWDEGSWHWCRGACFFFQTLTSHCSQTPYLISREENPNLQLLLIRVKWSQPANSYRTPKKLFLSPPCFFFFSNLLVLLLLCLSLHLSLC